MGKISIIIPSYNRPNELKKTIESILKTRYKDYEIIVSLDADIDSLKFLKKLKKKHKKIRIIFSKKPRGRCKAKNDALKVAKGEIIVFFDDDVIVDRNYFNVILPYYRNPKVGGVGGREVKLMKRSFIRNVWLKLRRDVGKVRLDGEVISNFDLCREVREVDTFVGCNMSFRRNVIEEVKGFDENYIGIAYREETDLCWRIKQKGYKLIFDPKAKVIHREEEKSNGLKRWSYWYFINNTYFFMKNLYQKKLIRLLKFILKELMGSFLRVLAYKKPYFLIYFPRIFIGIRFYYSKKVEK